MKIHGGQCVLSEKLFHTYLHGPYRKVSAKVGFQNLTSGSVFHSAYGLLLDLSNAFAGQVKFLSNLLKGEGLLCIEAKVKSDDITFTGRERG